MKVKIKALPNNVKGVIPSGSSIITAEGGMNKKALQAYQNKDWNKLDKIINSMPEDKSGKKAEGGLTDISTYTKVKPGFYPATRTGSAKGYKNKRTKYSQEQVQKDSDAIVAGKLSTTDFIKKHGQAALDHQNLRQTAKANKQTEYFDPKYSKGPYKSGFNIPTIGSQPNTLLPNPNQPNGGLKVGAKPQYTEDYRVKLDKEKTKTPDKFNPSNIPSLFELGAKVNALSQGIDQVPENYLKLGRYKYASQLPKNLQENMMATNTAKSTIKNVSGGNVGNYLSNVSNITTGRLKANNDAVIADTLARQEILNKNVDLGNTEVQTNLGLKNTYNDIKARRRGAYQDMMISAGQSADAAFDTYKGNKAQENFNNQYLDALKDTFPNYTLDENGRKIFRGKKGVKNIKYRRK